MNRAACRGAIHRSAGARSVDSSGRRKAAPLCAGRNHNPGRLAMGPYLLGGGRTAVCYSSPISVERAYCGMVEEAISIFSQTGQLQEEGPEGLCWGGGGRWLRRAGSHLLRLP